MMNQFISKELPRPIVKLRHKVTGKEIYVINVHNAPWDYQFKRNKATNVQIAKINELRATGTPGVLHRRHEREARDPLQGARQDRPGQPVRRLRTTTPPASAPTRAAGCGSTGSSARRRRRYANFEYTRPPLLSLVTDHNMALVDVRLP